jgi:ATP-dependent RNA helicase RhlE
MSIHFFHEAHFSEAILKAVEALGFTHPTPVQAQAFPILLAGRDLLAVAQTGTGKTAAFGLPILEKIQPKEAPCEVCTDNVAKPQALILAPTRELASQIDKNIRDYAHFLAVDTALLVGGVGLVPQMQQLGKRPEIIVATPGRLMDHMRNNRVDLSDLSALVLDEADRMLDMGFIDDILKILKKCPTDAQRMLFSATVTRDVKDLAERLLNRPRLIEIAPNRDVDAIEQKVYRVKKADKHRLLRDLIVDGQWEQVLVFTRLKTGATKLAKELLKDGFAVESLHGDRTQAARTKALSRFKDKTVQILVATDVAARGIDIESLPYVVNFDLPTHAEDYVHRIGRTGRAGKTGLAVSFVEPSEILRLATIEKLIGKRLPIDNLAPDVPDETTDVPLATKVKTTDKVPSNPKKPSRAKQPSRERQTSRLNDEQNRNSRTNRCAEDRSQKRKAKPAVEFDYVMPDF